MISSFDSAIALENDPAIVWNDQHEALMTIGNYSQAHEFFDKALHFAPEYSTAEATRDLALAKRNQRGIKNR